MSIPTLPPVPLKDYHPNRLDTFRWEYPCRVTNVVDGDTIDVILDRGMGDYSERRFRLHGIDTPEKHAVTGYERDAAQRATIEALSWIVGHPVLVMTTYRDPDNFGRWLGELRCAQTGQVLNTVLLELELASPWPVRWHDAYPAPTGGWLE